jgi:hypothetical protein
MRSDPLVQLPKRDLALCFFNSSILTSKIADALSILSLSSSPPSSSAPLPAATSTSAAPATLSLKDLAALPLSELIQKLEAGEGGKEVTKPTEEKKKETEAFMDGLEGRGVNEVRLFFSSCLFLPSFALPNR